MELVFLAVKILHLSFFQVGGLKRIHGPVGAVDDYPGDHVPELAAVKGLALAGLGKLKVDNNIRLFINLDL